MSLSKNTLGRSRQTKSPTPVQTGRQLLLAKWFRQMLEQMSAQPESNEIDFFTDQKSQKDIYIQGVPEILREIA